LAFRHFELSDEFLTGFKAIERTKKSLYQVKRERARHAPEIFRQNTKEVFVLAPTGIAAINSHGQTIHSFSDSPSDTKDHIKAGF